MRGILPSAPLDLVDLLLDLEGLEIVELRFVGLKLCVELVFASFLLLGCQCRASPASQQVAGLTLSFRSNNTTLPPLSPVAR